mmetsp:Transcript_43965/g.99400  ORF Transcript_43965/g.99400 Transcript_43965/m.99400 type:complete len:377 (+) Transcript_43965:395-1525(+)
MHQTCSAHPHMYTSRARVHGHFPALRPPLCRKRCNDAGRPLHTPLEHVTPPPADARRRLENASTRPTDAASTPRSNLPELDARVRAARGQLVLRDKGQRVDSARRVGQVRLRGWLLRRQAGGRPHKDGGVDAAGGEQPAARPHHRGDACRMVAAEVHDERGPVLDRPDHNLLVGAAGGQLGPVPREGGARDGAAMPLEFQPLSHALAVEQVHRAIIAADRDRAAIRRDGDARGIDGQRDCGATDHHQLLRDEHHAHDATATRQIDRRRIERHLVAVDPVGGGEEQAVVAADADNVVAVGSHLDDHRSVAAFLRPVRASKRGGESSGHVPRAEQTEGAASRVLKRRGQQLGAAHADGRDGPVVPELRRRDFPIVEDG